MSYGGRAGARFVRRAGPFALALPVSLCAAQTQGETKQGVCRAAGRTFACPEGFAPAADIAAPSAPPDAKAFEEGLAAEVASRLFPPRPRGYRWKRMEAPSKLSRHETGAGAAQAFGDEAGSVVTECAVQDLVGALTGEAVDPADTPCAVVVRPGRDRGRRPGASPKLPRAKVVRPPGR